jgi:ketopantoate hydroxymethyltransferase
LAICLRSYERYTERLFEAAMQSIKEKYAEAVKLEGDKEKVPTIILNTSIGKPVIANVKLTPALA